MGFKQDDSVLSEHTRRFRSVMNDRAKFFHQACRGERELPVVLVNVKLTSLYTSVSRRFSLEHRRADTMEVKNTGQNESSQPCADNRYFRHISVSHVLK
ncbi:hypothetical protein AA23498_2686 [Acetobacter nitrogenifigens DSM 23921 = NBRC 105050]|nr:hypothetical protein AA23498_2686 [Acetobacter nitrogenifigens DSM 23921 = NBRC 105050]